jgi:hypothetical protein
MVRDGPGGESARVGQHRRFLTEPSLDVVEADKASVAVVSHAFGEFDHGLEEVVLTHLWVLISVTARARCGM